MGKKRKKRELTPRQIYDRELRNAPKSETMQSLQRLCIKHDLKINIREAAIISRWHDKLMENSK